MKNKGFGRKLLTVLLSAAMVLPLFLANPVRVQAAGRVIRFSEVNERYRQHGISADAVDIGGGKILRADYAPSAFYIFGEGDTIVNDTSKPCSIYLGGWSIAKIMPGASWSYGDYKVGSGWMDHSPFQNYLSAVNGYTGGEKKSAHPWVVVGTEEYTGLGEWHLDLSPVEELGNGLFNERMIQRVNDVTKALNYTASAQTAPAANTQQQTTGAGESRESFDSKTYADTYADLKAAFGYDHDKLWNHYISFGKKENRKATFTGTAKASGGTQTTTAQPAAAQPAAAAPASQTSGVIVNRNLDWSPVFDASFYASRYPDLAAAGMTTEAQLKNHFLQYGMWEKRQSSGNFDIHVYMKYTDLQTAFGNSYPLYYQHYAQYGKNENRVAK